MYFGSNTNNRQPGRGFTLVEMLVVVALLILMMTILASIFQQATGAISISRTYQELDNNLRHLDQTIRSDLANITAKMTPPNNPANKTGYFEYGENAPADAQGEDTDDYLAFTVKAPEGQPFQGRTWLGPTLNNGTQVYPNQGVMPITITSDFAEVIYFLRNGNLYRRVLLIVPERQPSAYCPGSSQLNQGLFTAGLFSGLVTTSWQSVNDISARPTVLPTSAFSGQNPSPMYNGLGDVTNRENRFARQRFCNDYWNLKLGVYNNSNGQDGVVDDGNFNGIPDYWPTLTASQVAIARGNAVGTINGLMNEDSGSLPSPNTVVGGYYRVDDPGSKQNGVPMDVYAFPFIFPNMYSVPEAYSVTNNLGWLHSVDPGTVTVGGATAGPGGIIPNQAPLDLGDSLVTPKSPQTWYGFPTFREMASGNWRDPVEGPGNLSHHYPGVGTGIATASNLGLQEQHLHANQQNLLPSPTTNPGFLPIVGSMPPLGTPSAPAIPYGFDGVGDSTQPWALVTVPSTVAVASATQANLAQVWDDDLIMTGVRSFDVKAYDPNATLYNSTANGVTVGYNAGYYDLGYAATDYVRYQGVSTLVTSTPIGFFNPATLQPVGFGHEGRMPPLPLDNRTDPQRPTVKSVVNNAIVYVPNNVGDLGTAFPTLAPQRLRRVWDSWSTDYTNAPAIDVNLRGSPIQLPPLDRPIYPSYPPPYPDPLRGIQIQIRVTDVKNERVKILTIRQDFSDKL